MTTPQRDPGDLSWHGTTNDACLKLFLACQRQWQMPFAPGSRILEIGCAEADWLTLAEQNVPGAELIGVDFRKAKRPGTVLRGDVRDVSLPDDSLDWVVLVSALEHIGLGLYGDPVFSQGDRVTLGLVRRWLKPGGSVYFDVPWTPGHAYLDVKKHDAIEPWDERWRTFAHLRRISCLVYDDARLEWLQTIGGWRVERSGWLLDTVTECRPDELERPWVYRPCWWVKA